METVVDRTGHHVEGHWRALSNLQLPPKILHFLWRLLRDTLPTRGRLHRRGLDISGVCGLCGQGYEEDCNLVMECIAVERGWHTHALDGTIRDINSPAIELRD
ncbi:hypothetical protein LINGRAHAP2_LOCUS7350 [Linum grandiflorum]